VGQRRGAGAARQSCQAKVSVIGGVAFVLAAIAGGNPNLSVLAIYGATGGTEFVIQAWLLARRRRSLASTADPVPSAS
jgi:hypothetical protein